MSIQILDTVDRIITVEITGRIRAEELRAHQAEIYEQLKEWEGGSLLTIIEEFEGLEDGDWSDLSFQMQADPLIHKMAILGDRKWEEFAHAFTGKGVRDVPIEFFPTGHMIEAVKWLKD